MRFTTFLIITFASSTLFVIKVHAGCSQVSAHWADVCNEVANEKDVTVFSGPEQYVCGGVQKQKQSDLCCGVFECDPVPACVELTGGGAYMSLACDFPKCGNGRTALPDQQICGNVNGCVRGKKGKLKFGVCCATSINNVRCE